ncbi:hypothetical protein H9P43_004142 [Blastocladiella emersonii ATCC 22665]|nr:hypothetical protein H9P43_004142 [Blastocladiella emersonii ATCC 22665]
MTMQPPNGDMVCAAIQYVEPPRAAPGPPVPDPILARTSMMLVKSPAVGTPGWQLFDRLTRRRNAAKGFTLSVTGNLYLRPVFVCMQGVQVHVYEMDAMTIKLISEAYNTNVLVTMPLPYHLVVTVGMAALGIPFDFIAQVQPQQQQQITTPAPPPLAPTAPAMPPPASYFNPPSTPSSLSSAPASSSTPAVPPQQPSTALSFNPPSTPSLLSAPAVPPPAHHHHHSGSACSSSAPALPPLVHHHGGPAGRSNPYGARLQECIPRTPATQLSELTLSSPVRQLRFVFDVSNEEGDSDPEFTTRMAWILRELNDGVASSSSSTTAVQTAAPQMTNASSLSLTAVQPAVSQVDATVASSSSTSTLSTAVQPARPPVGSSAASSAASSSSSSLSTSSATVALAAPIIEEAGTTDREVASATAIPADAPKRTAAMAAEEGGDDDEDEFEAVSKRRRRRRGGRS